MIFLSTPRAVCSSTLPAGYRDLVENVEELICTHDLAGNLLTVNESLVRQMGYERPEDLVGRNLSEALAPDVRHQFGSYLHTITEEGRPKSVWGYISLLSGGKL